MNGNGRGINMYHMATARKLYTFCECSLSPIFCVWLVALMLLLSCCRSVVWWCLSRTKAPTHRTASFLEKKASKDTQAKLPFKQIYRLLCLKCSTCWRTARRKKRIRRMRKSLLFSEKTKWKICIAAPHIRSHTAKLWLRSPISICFLCILPNGKIIILVFHVCFVVVVVRSFVCYYRHWICVLVRAFFTFKSHRALFISILPTL